MFLTFIIIFFVIGAIIGAGQHGIRSTVAKHSDGVHAKVINTTRSALFCYVLFELNNGERVNLQVPSADFVTFIQGEEGTLSYCKDTYKSFIRQKIA